MTQNNDSKQPKADKLASVRGMNDMLPAEAGLWEFFEDSIRAWMHCYGYQQIRTPILEHTRVFTRGIGEVTDIVEKEMYTFNDALNGESLTLRPENTASVVRAAIEHNLLFDGPKRLWYYGPMFRHERPQRGRYRQFYQVGVEALGFAGPDIDGEALLMCNRLWEDLGLENIQLHLNTLGNAEERAQHRSALVDYFTAHHDALDEDSKRRLLTNPLRILDSKNPALQGLIEGAPKLLDLVGAESRAHFDGVQKILRDAGVSYQINPRLVRGLDYYNLTVFEWVTDQLGAQGTVCGGGRYDPLIAQMGGKPAPAFGLAMGVERILELLKAGGETGYKAQTDVYVVHQGVGAQATAFRVAEGLRDAGLDVILHCGDGGFKAQFKKADASGAAFAVVIGEDEVKQRQASVKSLRDQAHDGQQVKVALKDLADYLSEQLLGNEDDEA